MRSSRWRLLRRCWSYYRPYKSQISIGLLLNLVYAGLMLVTPWPFKLIVDGILPTSAAAAATASRQLVQNWLGWAAPQGQVAILCGVMVLASALASWLSYRSASLELNVGLRAVVGLRASLYEALQYLPLRYHDKVRSSDSSFRVAYDAQAIQSMYNGVVIPVVAALLALGGSFVVMLRLNLLLTIVSIGVIPLVFWSIHHYSRRIGAHSMRKTEAESLLLGIAQEALSSMKVVKAHGKEEHELERFLISAEESRISNYHLYKTQIKSAITIGFMTTLGTALLYLVGSIQVLQGKLSLGGVLVFVSYLVQLYRPIEQISGIAGVYAGATAGLKRSFEILDHYEESKEDEKLPPLEVRCGHVSFEDLSFGYQEGQPILSNLNLQIRPGEVLAIVGRTGEGKSTLLSLLGRFYEPTSGCIRIDGQDISRHSKSSLRHSLSIVLQDTLLFSASIAENIRYGRSNASDLEVREAALRAEAYDFISQLPHGFETQIGERGGRLSGGQRQRIAIARAFLRNSPILLLDEPTSALDPITEERISQAMLELMKGRTTLLVTHRLTLAHRADRIAVLKEGRVAEIGTPAELQASKGIYASMFASGK
jgi:ABC-type multidrug transport system fused ATPase/permease subunit